MKISQVWHIYTTYTQNKSLHKMYKSQKHVERKKIHTRIHILPSNLCRILDQAKLTYSVLYNSFTWQRVKCVQRRDTGEALTADYTPRPSRQQTHAPSWPHRKAPEWPGVRRKGKLRSGALFQGTQLQGMVNTWGLASLNNIPGLHCDLYNTQAAEVWRA